MAINMTIHRKIRSQREDAERALKEAQMARERKETVKRLNEELKRLNEEEEKKQGELKRIDEEREKKQGELKLINEEKEKIQNELRAINGETIKTEIKSAISDPNFILVDVESLSLDDEFMKYNPRSSIEIHTKELISQAIQKGVKNFYRPRGDVSLTEDGNGICYAPGKMPALGKSYNWYEKAAKEFMPERNSRLGTKLEYFAFLGVLIKKLVAEGRGIEWAWNAVCCDSCELGHYKNSEDAKNNFEPTGSRWVCGFYDLANASKILAWDEELSVYWVAACHYNGNGFEWPLARFNETGMRDIEYSCTIGWVVLS